MNPVLFHHVSASCHAVDSPPSSSSTSKHTQQLMKDPEKSEAVERERESPRQYKSIQKGTLDPVSSPGCQSADQTQLLRRPQNVLPAHQDG